MTVTLTAPGLGTLALSRMAGYVVTELDLGFPTPRVVAEDRVNASDGLQLRLQPGWRPKTNRPGERQLTTASCP